MVTCRGTQSSGCKGAGRTSDSKSRGPSSDGLVCLLVALSLAFSTQGFSAETNASPTQTSPPAAAGGTNLAAFQLAAGFRIELVASEPMVSAPVAMAFDENGRLFVVEMHGDRNRDANSGRVRLLENMNEEGVFQNSTIYADGLPWPSAVACYAGGIFVAAAPDILYLKDTKGDGIADARQVVLSGFGGAASLNPELLPNNFNWGPDNRIHGVSAGIGGEVSAENGAKLVSIARCDFSFDPRTLEVFAEAGPAESGLSFDSHGRKFVSSYLRPLMYPMYQLRYTLRNPYYPKPPAMAVITDPAAPIYHFVLQPRPASARPATNLIVASSMTRARGCAVYRGRAFPTNYFDNVFIADSDAHVIHRLVLQQNGFSMVAQRAADEAGTEFLMSRDPSFRPIQVINGPDGSLYIADMQDGGERGRIYRILPNKIKRSKLPQIGQAKTFELVSTLAQGDGWHRDTAARLLYERKDPAAPPLLRGTLNRSRLTEARVAALHALAGAGALTEQDVLKALTDSEPEVREQGVAVSEALFTRGDASEPILAQFRALAADPSPGVRYQLAFTLGQLQRPDKAIPLAQILGLDLANPWLQNAVLSSTADNAGNLFITSAGDGRFRNDPASFGFLQQLATMTGVSGHRDAVSQIFGFIASGGLPLTQAYALLYSLGDGLYRTRSSLALVDSQGVLSNFYAGALGVATDVTQPEPARLAATRLLAFNTQTVEAVAAWLLIVCNPPTTPALQSAAVETMSRYADPQIGNALLQMWPVLAPVARDRAITALMSRESQLPALFDALQAGGISVSELSSTQRNFLRTHPTPDVRQRALQLLGPVPMTRPQVVEQFKPALSSRGAVDRGRQIFVARCAGCHLQAQSPGGPLGPMLLRARTFTKEQLLAKITQPNLSVRPDYATQIVQSKDGQSLIGIVTDENTATITLKQAGGGTQVWPQSNLGTLRPQSWSLMPEGLEIGLSPQDMDDLIEYVLTGNR